MNVNRIARVLAVFSMGMCLAVTGGTCVPWDNAVATANNSPTLDAAGHNFMNSLIAVFDHNVGHLADQVGNHNHDDDDH